MCSSSELSQGSRLKGFKTEDLQEKGECKKKHMLWISLYMLHYQKHCTYVFQNWALGYIFIPQYKGKYIPNKAMLFQQSKGWNLSRASFCLI